ncbi:ankyrin repeat-containing domain protein [Zopfochytrium polystomum]|nr:ankyrin repeat-containing domain protein [Zopfochytrium polystomum]
MAASRTNPNAWSVLRTACESGHLDALALLSAYVNGKRHPRYSEFFQYGGSGYPDHSHAPILVWIGDGQVSATAQSSLPPHGVREALIDAAVRFGHLNILRYLHECHYGFELQHRPEVSQETNEMTTPSLNLQDFARRWGPLEHHPIGRHNHFNRHGGHSPRRYPPPILLASKNGHPDILHYLISRGCEIEATSTNRETPLVKAARQSLSAWRRRTDSMALDPQPLLLWPLDGPEAAVTEWARNKFLQQQQKEIFSLAVVAKPYSLSAVAPFPYWNLTVAEFISKNEKGSSPSSVLQAATLRLRHAERLASIRLLIDAGANLNAVTEYGWTALHHVCFNDKGTGPIDRDILSLLLGVSYPSTLPSTPLTFTRPAHRRADPNALTVIEAGSPLYIALGDSGDPEAGSILHFAGADVSLSLGPGSRRPERPGFTSLHQAARRGHFGAVLWLSSSVNRFKSVFVPDVDGNTPLHIAASEVLSRGSIEVVAFFLGLDESFGVDANAVNLEGQTALDLAGSAVVEHLLRANGGKRAATHDWVEESLEGVGSLDSLYSS